MVAGNRELIAGVVRDPQFGANVMLGVGGILAEAIADVVFRPVPISAVDADEMIDQLATQQLLGAFRGEAPVDRAAARAVLLGLSAAAVDRPDIASIDVNPLIIRSDGAPIAVDALVELGDDGSDRAAGVARVPATSSSWRCSNRGACWWPGPRRIPGKFGFVSLHNLLASGYRGAVYGTNLQSEIVLGIQTVADIDELPDGAIDLVFVCTPASANPRPVAGLRRARASRRRS